MPVLLSLLVFYIRSLSAIHLNSTPFAAVGRLPSVPGETEHLGTSVGGVRPAVCHGVAGVSWWGRGDSEDLSRLAGASWPSLDGKLNVKGVACPPVSGRITRDDAIVAD